MLLINWLRMKRKEGQVKLMLYGFVLESINQLVENKDEIIKYLTELGSTFSELNKTDSE